MSTVSVWKNEEVGSVKKIAEAITKWLYYQFK